MKRGYTIRAVGILITVLLLAGCVSSSTGTAEPTRSKPQTLPTSTPIPTPTPQHVQSPLPAPRSEQSISPLPSPTTPDEKATTASQDTVAHMRADLAARLEIPQDEIVHVGSHLLLWQADRMQCPPSVEAPSGDHIMIVDQDGARYELPRAETKPAKTPASLHVFSANDQIYRYYVVKDHTLFCPDRP